MPGALAVLPAPPELDPDVPEVVAELVPLEPPEEAVVGELLWEELPHTAENQRGHQNDNRPRIRSPHRTPLDKRQQSNGDSD